MAQAEGQDWEVKDILGKERTKQGWEYTVVGASSWLPRSELGNASTLVQKLEGTILEKKGFRRGQPAPGVGMVIEPKASVSSLLEQDASDMSFPFYRQAERNHNSSELYCSRTRSAFS